jgi:hypothetical protein
MTTPSHPLRRHNDYLKWRDAVDRREEEYIRIQAKPLIEAADIAGQKRSIADRIFDVLGFVVLVGSIAWGMRVMVWPILVWWFAR